MSQVVLKNTEKISVRILLFHLTIDEVNYESDQIMWEEFYDNIKRGESISILEVISEEENDPKIFEM